METYTGYQFLAFISDIIDQLVKEGKTEDVRVACDIRNRWLGLELQSTTPGLLDRLLDEQRTKQNEQVASYKGYEVGQAIYQGSNGYIETVYMVCGCLAIIKCTEDTMLKLYRIEYLNTNRGAINDEELRQKLAVAVGAIKAYSQELYNQIPNCFLEDPDPNVE